MNLPSIVLTTGEPAGIGPDLALLIAQQELPCALVALADIELLHARAALLGNSVKLQAIAADQGPKPHQPGTLQVWHEPLEQPSQAGRLDPRNSHLCAAPAGPGGYRLQGWIGSSNGDRPGAQRRHQ